MRWTFIAFLLGAAAAVADPGGGFDESKVRERYVNSPSLPTEIAYREFLRLLVAIRDQTRDGYIHTLAEVLDYDVDSAGHREAFAYLDPRGEYFLSQYRRLRLENLEVKIEVACSAGRPATKEEIFSVFDALDDLDELLAKKYYLVAAQALQGRERAAFKAYLERLKSSITYVKLGTAESRKTGTPGVDPSVFVPRACEDFKAEYETLTSGGH